MSSDIMGTNEGTIDQTLKKRGSIYGDYGEVVAIRTGIMELLMKHYEEVNGEPMPEAWKTMFGDIVLKLVRASGKPTYPDSWHDLAGYATLIERKINEIG